METKHYTDGPDKVDASEELVRKTKLYMESHPDVDYTTASNAVLQADPELARNYAGNTGSYDAEVKENNFIPSKPQKLTEHQAGMQASAQIAQKAELIMLERNLDYVTAQQIVFKRHPELLKQYTAGIIEGE